VNHKKLIIPLIASILLFPFVFAQRSTLAPLTDAISMFANFIFVDISAAIGETMFLRILIWILLFAIFYAVLTNFPWEKSPFKKKNIALPISMIVALISVIFIPGQFLITIGFAYGFTTSFLLMALPVIAVIYLAYVIFPTSAEKVPEPGKRRVNHSIKAVIFYFVATLVTNYTAIQKIENLPKGWIDLSDLVIAGCMFLFLYHIILAIFTTSGAKEEKGEPGLIEKVLHPSAREEGIPTTEEKEKKETDFSPIIGRIGELNNLVNQYEQAAEQLMRESGAIRNIADAEFEKSQQIREFLEHSRAARALGARVEAAAHAVSDLTELFRNLPNQYVVQLADIVRRIRLADEMIIDAILNATG